MKLFRIFYTRDQTTSFIVQWLWASVFLMALDVQDQHLTYPKVLNSQFPWTFCWCWLFNHLKIFPVIYSILASYICFIHHVFLMVFLLVLQRSWLLTLRGFFPPLCYCKRNKVLVQNHKYSHQRSWFPGGIDASNVIKLINYFVIHPHSYFQI